ncbi:hypothetical protein HYDPIDRAFT_101636, partial [Hydnomerulius pinastri MD-312]
MTWCLTSGHIAHEDAFKIGVLHRDVSAGNIIIFLGHGLLIDWDLAKSVDSKGPRQIMCTGTWQFMSVELIYDRKAPHTFRDDLESTFYVLLWTAVMFASSSL